MANTLGAVREGTRLARDRDVEQWQLEARRYTALMNNAVDPEDRAIWKAQLDQVVKNISGAGAATAESNAGAQRVYNTADKLTESGNENINEAKKGLGKLGRLAVDVGVAGTQMGADAGLGALTGGSALVPMAVRSFGGGAQEARQSGADIQKQLAYGVGNAAIQVGTEKISNVSAPFRKMFGEGVLDKALAQANSKLMQSTVGRAALSAAGEASEEAIGDLLDAPLRRLTFDKNATVDKTQMLSDALVGGILGLAGSGAEAVGNGIRSARKPAAVVSGENPVGSITDTGTSRVEAPVQLGAVAEAARAETSGVNAAQRNTDLLLNRTTEAENKNGPPAQGAEYSGQRVDRSDAPLGISATQEGNSNVAPETQKVNDVAQIFLEKPKNKQGRIDSSALSKRLSPGSSGGFIGPFNGPKFPP